MPGFILSNDAKLNNANFPITRSEYLFKSISTANDFNLNTYCYDGYPVEFKQVNEKEWFYQEGLIYNETISISELISQIKKGELNKLGAEIRSMDGDFIFIYFDQSTNLITIINDNLGKLPTYIYEYNGEIIITREIEVLTKSKKKLTRNKKAEAIQLLFGHFFGTETAWNEVTKLSSNSITQICTKKNKIEQQHFFELPLNKNNTMKPSTVEEISSAIKESITGRLSKIPQPSLSLSGGLDSRLLAGYIFLLNQKTPYTTYRIDDYQNSIDVSSAKEIQRLTGNKNQHYIFALNEFPFKDRMEMFNIKRGLNPMTMSILLPYLRELKKNKLSTITGEGGDYFISDISPLTKIHTKTQLVKYLIKFRGISSIETAASCTGLTKNEILHTIERQLDSYPVSSIPEKHNYFLCKERYINWNIEGEDRNRFYVWSSSPFNSPKVIRLGLTYPMKKKKFGGLFLALFKHINSDLPTVINPNWRVPLTDTKNIRKVHLKQSLKAYIPKKFISKKTVDFEDKPFHELFNQDEKKIHLDEYSTETFFWTYYSQIQNHLISQ